jgi:hypothetical protein
MRLISGYRDFGYGVHDYDIPRSRHFWNSRLTVGWKKRIVFSHSCRAQALFPDERPEGAAGSRHGWVDEARLS